MHRPVTSVTQTCDAGNLVIYASEGGYSYCLEDGSRTSCDCNCHVYELDLWLKAEDANVSVDESFFTRPRQ